MNSKIFKNFLAGAAISVLSFSSYAVTAEEFQTNCTNSWMQSAGDAADKVDFKNFGEKYCGCASKLPLNNTEDANKAIKTCLSQTLLHDAMDSVEEEVGLTEAKDTDITAACEGRWKLIMVKPTEADKKAASAYCECAKPKLVDLIKQSNSMTDKQYAQAIDAVADSCVDNVKVSGASN